MALNQPSVRFWLKIEVPQKVRICSLAIISSVHVLGKAMVVPIMIQVNTFMDNFMHDIGSVWGVTMYSLINENHVICDYFSSSNHLSLGKKGSISSFAVCEYEVNYQYYMLQAIFVFACGLCVYEVAVIFSIYRRWRNIGMSLLLEQTWWPGVHTCQGSFTNSNITKPNQMGDNKTSLYDRLCVGK